MSDTIDRKIPLGTRLAVLFGGGDNRLAYFLSTLATVIFCFFVLEGIAHDTEISGVIYIVIGIVMFAALYFYHGLKQANRGLKLMQQGRLTNAILYAKETTELKGLITHRLTFNYHDQLNNDHQLVVQTTSTAKLKDEVHEKLLFLPVSPKHAILVDSLPQNIRINSDDSIDPIPFIYVLSALLMPLLFVACTALSFVVNMGSL